MASHVCLPLCAIAENKVKGKKLGKTRAKLVYDAMIYYLKSRNVKIDESL